MRKRKTHKEYVSELLNKNNNVVAIDNYIDANTPIKHLCLKHNVEWETTPSRVLHGAGCNLCHSEKISSSKYKTNEKYIKEVKMVSPHIDVLERYIDSRTPILHRCNIHNIEWDATPSNVLKGCGCYKCGNEKTSDKNTKTFEDYIFELKKSNPNIICIGEYKNSTTLTLHKCLVDGNTWMAIPSQILTGRGCPVCKESHGEREIRQWLINQGILFEMQKTFSECRDKAVLPFDFFLPKDNVIIEYDGEQHFRPVSYFGGEKRFKYIQKHDKLKDEYCLKNNIKLLRIPYYKNIQEELNNFYLA